MKSFPLPSSQYHTIKVDPMTMSPQRPAQSDNILNSRDGKWIQLRNSARVPLVQVCTEIETILSFCLFLEILSFNNGLSYCTEQLCCFTLFRGPYPKGASQRETINIDYEILRYYN